MVPTEFNWRELQPDEIVLRLSNINMSAGSAQTGFLDVHLWTALLGHPSLTIDGGYDQAYFRKAYMGSPAPGICFMEIPASALPENARSPRGLRAHLARSINPELVGDIVAGDPMNLVTDEEGKALLEQIGAEVTGNWRVPEVGERKVTASANRLDALVSSVCQVSRGEAQTAIEYGFVFVNYLPVSKRTASIKTGDQLVFRDRGRYEITQIGENPRSKRLWISFRPYPV